MKCLTIICSAIAVCAAFTVPIENKEGNIRVIRSAKHHHLGGLGVVPIHYVENTHNSFAGSSANAGSGVAGHGSQSLSQSQAASFSFGPFSASFAQSQAGSQSNKGFSFFDY